MNLLKTVAFLGLTIGTLVLSTGEAHAAKNRYAMIAFKNPTNFTIKYYFRWGRDNEWKLFDVKAGEVHWHSWEYDYVNENRSPIPQIKFDADLSDDVDWVVYSLNAFAAPAQDADYAKVYKFVTRRSGILDVIAVGE